MTVRGDSATRSGDIMDRSVVLASTERPSAAMTVVVTQHLAAVVATITGTSAALFAVVEAGPGQTIGIGSVVALLCTVLGIVFRTQQQQIVRMSRRIEHLETELDFRRGRD